MIETQVILSITLYKMVSLLVGGAFSYMGYRLFISGIWGNAGSLETHYENNRLVLKNAAPGTFFALFGAIIVSITLLKGLEFERYAPPVQTNPIERKLPDAPPF